MLYLIGGIVLQIVGTLTFGGAIGKAVENDKKDKENKESKEEVNEKPGKLTRRGLIWGLLFMIVASYLFVQYGTTLVK